MIAASVFPPELADEPLVCASCGEALVVATAHATVEGFVCDGCHRAPAICGACNGSGDGSADGTRCRACRGRGERAVALEEDC